MNVTKRKTKKQGSMVSDRAVEYILTRNLEELRHLTGEKVAGNLHVNPTSLLEEFKIHQKVTLTQFILREKIHRAVFILEKTPTVSIERLSQELGFSQTHDFVEEFGKYILIDPYRFKELKIKSL